MEFKQFKMESDFEVLGEVIESKADQYFLSTDTEYHVNEPHELEGETKSKVNMLIVTLKLTDKERGRNSHIPLGYYCGEITKEVIKEEKMITVYCNNLIMKNNF